VQPRRTECQVDIKFTLICATSTASNDDDDDDDDNDANGNSTFFDEGQVAKTESKEGTGTGNHR